MNADTLRTLIGFHTKKRNQNFYEQAADNFMNLAIQEIVMTNWEWLYPGKSIPVCFVIEKINKDFSYFKITTQVNKAIDKNAMRFHDFITHSKNSEHKGVSGFNGGKVFRMSHFVAVLEKRGFECYVKDNKLIVTFDTF